MRTHNHIGAMKQLASLEAWNCANALARSAYRLTLRKPLSGHFGLSDQIRRAAVSVPANMVEGYALGTTLQFIRCLRVAFGSAAELHCRSEEHTSELQSQSNLVCRLLLEKKKIQVRVTVSQ